MRELLERIHPISSRWQPRSAGFARSAVPTVLPAEYRAFIDDRGAGEGFIGTRLLRLYPLDELAAVNVAYAIDTYLPGHLLFGSDGIGQALLFDLSSRVVEVPFIPLDAKYITAKHDDFVTFLEAFATIPKGSKSSLPIAPNPQTIGLEVHEIHPVVLGGDPTSPENKVLLPIRTHAEACCYFNRLIHELRAQSQNE